MSALLEDLAKKGCKILQDTKTPRQASVKAKEIPSKEPAQNLDVHQAAVKKFVKDKPHKKHVLEVFEKIIEAEEKKL